MYAPLPLAVRSRMYAIVSDGAPLLLASSSRPDAADGLARDHRSNFRVRRSSRTSDGDRPLLKRFVASSSSSVGGRTEDAEDGRSTNSNARDGSENGSEMISSLRGGRGRESGRRDDDGGGEFYGSEGDDARSDERSEEHWADQLVEPLTPPSESDDRRRRGGEGGGKRAHGGRRSKVSPTGSDPHSETRARSVNFFKAAMQSSSFVAKPVIPASDTETFKSRDKSALIDAGYSLDVPVDVRKGPALLRWKFKSSGPLTFTVVLKLTGSGGDGGGAGGGDKGAAPLAVAAFGAAAARSAGLGDDDASSDEEEEGDGDREGDEFELWDQKYTPPAKEKWEKGALVVAKPGRVTVTWDNSGAWWGQTELSYLIELRAPDDRPVHRARSGALKAARDERLREKGRFDAQRRELESRRVGIIARRDAAEGEIEVVERRLRALELQRAAARTIVKSARAVVLRAIVSSFGATVVSTVMSFAGLDAARAWMCTGRRGHSFQWVVRTQAAEIEEERRLRLAREAARQHSADLDEKKRQDAERAQRKERRERELEALASAAPAQDLSQHDDAPADAPGLTAAAAAEVSVDSVPAASAATAVSGGSIDGAEAAAAAAVAAGAAASAHETSASTAIEATSDEPIMSGCIAIATFTFAARRHDELSVDAGDLVNVTQVDGGWLVGTSQRSGKSGHFPANYVVYHAPGESVKKSKATRPQSKSKSKTKSKRRTKKGGAHSKKVTAVVKVKRKGGRERKRKSNGK